MLRSLVDGSSLHKKASAAGIASLVSSIEPATLAYRQWVAPLVSNHDRGENSNVKNAGGRRDVGHADTDTDADGRGILLVLLLDAIAAACSTSHAARSKAAANRGIEQVMSLILQEDLLVAVKRHAVSALRAMVSSGRGSEPAWDMVCERAGVLIYMPGPEGLELIRR
jgi:hypothetical protein